MDDGDDGGWLFEEDPVPSTDHGMDAWRFGAAVAAAGAAFDIVPPTWARPHPAPVSPQPPAHHVDERQFTRASAAVDANTLLTEGVTDWDTFVGQEQILSAMHADLNSEHLDVPADLRHWLVPPWGMSRGQDHLFVGPRGSGRRTLALLMAKYSGFPIAVLSGPYTPEDFRSMVLGMEEGQILYVDELNYLLLTRRGREYLWDVGVDFSLNDNGRTFHRPEFLLAAGVTSPDMIPDEIRENLSERVYELKPYTESERLLIAVRCSQVLEIRLTAETLTEIAVLCDLPGSVRDLVMKCGRWQDDSGRTCSPADLPEIKNAFD